MRTPDGNVWLVWRGYRYQIWAMPIEPGLFDQASLGEPITSYWQLMAHAVVTDPAPVALAPFDGTFVIGPDSAIWLLSAGTRYPVLPLSIPADAITTLPRGPDLRTLQGFSG